MNKSWYANQFILKTFELSKDTKLILYMNFNHQLRAELYQNSSLFSEFSHDRIIIDTRPKMIKLFSTLFKSCFTQVNRNCANLPDTFFDCQQFIKNDSFEVNLVKYQDDNNLFLTIINTQYI
jgi:hypothetical protein